MGLQNHKFIRENIFKRFSFMFFVSSLNYFFLEVSSAQISAWLSWNSAKKFQRIHWICSLIFGFRWSEVKKEEKKFSVASSADWELKRMSWLGKLGLNVNSNSNHFITLLLIFILHYSPQSLPPSFEFDKRSFVPLLFDHFTLDTRLLLAFFAHLCLILNHPDGIWSQE